MRILCLGNNTELTDIQARELAQNNNLLCHGLLSEIDHPLVPENYKLPGVYHSSIYDIGFGRLFDLATMFDQLVVLNQKKEQYSHLDAFYNTIRLAKKMQTIVDVVFVDLTLLDSIDYFEELVNTNPSFCIFPFIELLTYNAHTTVCCRSSTPVTKISELKNFGTDQNYQTIRQKMLRGERIPEHCTNCYTVEAQGILSARQQETVEWANRLGLHSTADLENINHPVYYEVRASNTCNLQCRMCGPDSSQLINKEYVKLQLIDKEVDRMYSNFDIVDLAHVKKLYVSGGEPLAMPEFYEFVDRCIDSKQQFEFTVNTNATKLNNKFKKQLKQIPHMQFIISIDGYDRLNYYIRWPSVWNNIIANIDYLLEQGHIVSFNTTVSIYNISMLYELLSFIDCRYSQLLVHCQFAASESEILSPYNFPDRDLVLSNLFPIQQLTCYKNDPLLASFIDGLINHYQHHYQLNTSKLQKFFEFNSLLDQSRNIRLIDYIPELEKFR